MGCTVAGFVLQDVRLKGIPLDRPPGSQKGRSGNSTVEGYYREKLSGERLLRCYELAPPRVRQYLDAEIEFVLRHIRQTDVVLELGCGYGRVAFRLAEVAARVVGIDTASESLELARKLLPPGLNCDFVAMDALHLLFPDFSFDAVVCVENGICAFAVDQEALVREALRVTRADGVVLFFTYSDSFWPERLSWFEAQARQGLVGDIDYAASCDGVIVCTDGLRAGRLTREDFRAICSRMNVEPGIIDVDDSSLFCKIVRTAPGRQGHGGRRPQGATA